MTSRKKPDYLSRTRMRLISFADRISFWLSRKLRPYRHLISAGVIGLPVLVALFPTISRTFTDPLFANLPTRVVGIVTAQPDSERNDVRNIGTVPNLTTVKKRDKDGHVQKLPEANEPKLADASEPKQLEVNEPKPADVSEQKLAEVNEQKLAYVSEQKRPEVNEQKLADVSEQKLALAEIAGADGVGNVEFKGNNRPKNYLPPSRLLKPNGRANGNANKNTNASTNGSTKVTPGAMVTVPVSQGRLLRFDDNLDSVFIADPGIADIRMVSSDLIYVYGKTVGLTNLMAVSKPVGKDDISSGIDRKLTASVQLRVVVDQAPANEARQEWSPETPLDITIFGRRTAVRGEMRNIDEAVDTANLAETFSAKDQPPINKTILKGSNQINIRVRFAEVIRSDLRSFGIDWNVRANGGSFLFGLQKYGATQNPNLAARVKTKDIDIELLIEALQENGTLRILAEPNLTAVTGETASFLAGGEVPIPVPSGKNGESITVDYKPFGVSLFFTPTMVTGNRIALRIKPEVSTIASQTNFGIQGFNLPAFTVRRADTTVEMASGQTFAIAGLFQREITRDVSKVPILGDVPILGELFRSKRYQRHETELVILITPYLVRPVSDKSLTTPLEAADTSLLKTKDFIGLEGGSSKDALLK